MTKQCFIYPATAFRMLDYLKQNPDDQFGTLDMFPTWPSGSLGAELNIAMDVIWHPDLGI